MTLSIPVYFQDLSEQWQLLIWEEARSMLLASGWVEPRQEDETASAFERRVFEAVDHYLNTHNKLTISV